MKLFFSFSLLHGTMEAKIKLCIFTIAGKTVPFVFILSRDELCFCIVVVWEKVLSDRQFIIMDEGDRVRDIMRTC